LSTDLVKIYRPGLKFIDLGKSLSTGLVKIYRPGLKFIDLGWKFIENPKNRKKPEKSRKSRGWVLLNFLTKILSFHEVDKSGVGIYWLFRTFRSSSIFQKTRFYRKVAKIKLVTEPSTFSIAGHFHDNQKMKEEGVLLDGCQGGPKIDQNDRWVLESRTGVCLVTFFTFSCFFVIFSQAYGIDFCGFAFLDEKGGGVLLQGLLNPPSICGRNLPNVFPCLLFGMLADNFTPFPRGRPLLKPRLPWSAKIPREFPG
jgi:hypothetical protein